MKRFILLWGLLASVLLHAATLHQIAVFRLDTGIGTYGAGSYPTITQRKYTLIYLGTGSHPQPIVSPAIPSGWPTRTGDLVILEQDPPRGTRPINNNPPSDDYYPGGAYRAVAFTQVMSIYNDNFNWNPPLDPWGNPPDYWTIPPYNNNGIIFDPGNLIYPDPQEENPDLTPIPPYVPPVQPPPYVPPDESSIDSKAVVGAINNSRDALLDFLAAHLGSWVYDTAMTTAQLRELAAKYFPKLNTAVQDVASAVRDLEVKPVVNVEAPVVNVAPPAVNVTVEGSTADLAGIESRLDSIKNLIESHEDPVVDEIDDTGIADKIAEVTTKYVEWGRDGASALDSFGVSGLHAAIGRLFGPVPSFGSDSKMFSFHCDIPYIGAIDKEFDWTDYPYCGAIRSFLLYLAYVVFGLAIVRLLYKTMQA